MTMFDFAWVRKDCDSIPGLIVELEDDPGPQPEADRPPTTTQNTIERAVSRCGTRGSSFSTGPEH
jgi:hypothetical protein